MLSVSRESDAVMTPLHCRRPVILAASGGAYQLRSDFSTLQGLGPAKWTNAPLFFIRKMLVILFPIILYFTSTHIAAKTLCRAVPNNWGAIRCREEMYRAFNSAPSVINRSNFIITHSARLLTPRFRMPSIHTLTAFPYLLYHEFSSVSNTSSSEFT